jgi:hypothetical protein
VIEEEKEHKISIDPNIQHQRNTRTKPAISAKCNDKHKKDYLAKK